MWCDHCREEVIPVAGEENRDISECSQCGKHFPDFKTTTSDETQSDQTGSSSIALTAHALLKRWEANRPVADSSSAIEPTVNEPLTPVPVNVSAKKEIPAASALKVEPKKKPAPAITPDYPIETIFDDIPSGLDVSEMLPDLIPPVQAASTNIGSSEKQVARPPEIKKKPQPEIIKENPQTTQRKATLPPDLIPVAKIASPAITTRATPTVPERKQQKQTSQAGSTLASQNDAGSLLNRKPETISQRKTKSPSPQIQKQTGAVASPETKSEKPMKFKTKAPAPQAETSQGRVRFTPPEIDDDKIDDLGIQQAIEKHHRKQRNWSVLFGQFMVYGGALAMTCGIAIVIGNRFGSLEIVETTGWLTLAGGHLLFVLGVYTHLSSKMEQVWSDMHARNDEITRLLNQNVTTGIPRRTATAPATASSFQRGSLQETIREAA